MKKTNRKKLVLSGETILQLNRSTTVNLKDAAGGVMACSSDTCSLVFTCYNSDCLMCQMPGRPVIVDHAPLLASIVYDDASWCAEIDVK